MIELTKLNKQKITINAIYIERVEPTPDTLITLTNGKKIIVLETVQEVSDKVTAFYKKIRLFFEITEEQTDV